MATILVIGCKESGKTTFINRITTRNFDNKPRKENQIGCRFCTLEECSNGIVTLIDTSDMKIDKIRETLIDLNQCDGAIVLYGNTEDSIKNTTELFDKLTENVVLSIPVCHILTKIDLGNSDLLKKITYKNILGNQTSMLHSTKSCYNLYNPIEFVLKENKKYKDTEIKFFNL